MSDRGDRDLAALLASIDRRDFLRTTALTGAGVALGVLGAPRALATGFPEVWAYPDTYSILPMQTLRLHLSTSAWSTNDGTPATVAIHRVTDWRRNGWDAEPGDPALPAVGVNVHDTYNGPNNTAAHPGVEEWNWPQTVTIGTPGTPWIEPGFYIAETRATDSTAVAPATSWVPFVVRNPAADPAVPILYKVSLNTMQAYNYGPSAAPEQFRNSFYGNPIEVNGKIKITFRRPFTAYQVLVSLIDYNYPLVWWLRRQGYVVDFCTDLDVHLDTDGSLLSKYAAVISAGHDEYWSQEMYDHLASYRDRGGNLLFLSGNTCCWKVEYGDPDAVLNVPTSLFCGKPPGTADVLGTAAWWDGPTPKDNALVGAGTRNCATRISGVVAPFSPPAPYSRGYRVQNADHWIFAGSGVANGKVIGEGDVVSTTFVENLIGPEGGGARIDSFAPDGSAHLALNDGTPVNLALLGVARTDASDGEHELAFAPDCPGETCTKWKVFSREGSVAAADLNGVYAATMGFYTAYGAVFTGSTMNWGNVLNESDSHGGEHRHILQQWQTANGSATDGDGRQILGNPYLHRITRNLLDALSDRARDVRAIAGDLLILQTRTTGEPSFWRMDGLSRAAAGSILYDGTASPGPGTRIAAAASLEAGGTHLILQDNADSHLTYWAIAQAANGTISRQEKGSLVPGWADPEWALRVVIDQHATPTPRNLLIFQHTGDGPVAGTGALYYWQLDGFDRTSAGPFQPAWAADTSWKPVASLDLNGDGKDDLLFQHATTRELYYWLLDGTTVTGQGPLGSAPTAGWVVVGAYDVDGSGQKDIVFQNSGTGALYYWAVTANPIAAVPTGPVGSGSTWLL